MSEALATSQEPCPTALNVSEADTTSREQCATALDVNEVNEKSRKQCAAMPGTAKAVPPILRLPVELRDIIYDYAISHEAWQNVDFMPASDDEWGLQLLSMFPKRPNMR